MDQAQMQQMYQQYFYYLLAAGVIIGLILGAIPLIFAIRRGKKRLGWIAFLVCGIVGAFSPIGSLVAAVVFLVFVFRGPKAPIDHDNA